MKNDWFTSWFDTPYYHILYKNRDDSDAQFFMRNITQFLNLPKNSHIADLPCGKGRHAVFLNSLGYKVTGGDLSKNSIKFAKEFENDNLHFEVWDMRQPLENKYDAVFNLFTSFGYFDDDKEDINILKGFKIGLKENGILIFDFLNVEKVKDNLITEEVKVIDDINFFITREIKDGFIIKNINFQDNNKNYSFTEKVKFLNLEKLKLYFNIAGLEIQEIFGDYDLSGFKEATSNRLILVAK